MKVCEHRLPYRLAALLLAIAMTACGGGDDTAPPDSGDADSSSMDSGGLDSAPDSGSVDGAADSAGGDGGACVLELACGVMEGPIWRMTNTMLGIPRDPVIPLGAPDEDCDGVPETDCELTEYVGGFQTRFALDVDCDGEADSDCIRREGDAFMSRTTTDLTCDGVPDACTASRTDGGATTQGDDADCDGVPDTDCDSYVGGLRGLDADCDGTPDSECRVTITSMDLRISGADDDCDGTPDSGCYRELEVAGVTTRGRDDDCDGTLDRECSEEGPSGSFMDRDCDGTPDDDCIEVVESAVMRTRRIDPDCDGVPEQCEIEGLDSSGEVVTSLVDFGCDGTADAECSSQTVGSDGALIFLYDPDCDGMATACSVTQSDGVTDPGPTARRCMEEYAGWFFSVTNSRGDRIYEEYSTSRGSDCGLWTYDDDGRVLSTRLERPCGSEYREYRYVYSPGGTKIVRIEQTRATCVE